LTAETPTELFVEDDNASDSSDDSLALLPDLKPSLQNPNGPDVRAGRAHTALRRNHPGDSADKTPSGISYINLCFQYNNKESRHKNSGENHDLLRLSLVICSYIFYSFLLILLVLCTSYSHC